MRRILDAAEDMLSPTFWRMFFIIAAIGLTLVGVAMARGAWGALLLAAIVCAVLALLSQVAASND